MRPPSRPDERPFSSLIFSPRVKKTLKRGGIGVIPTDTIYGVVGCALSPDAVERIYKAKKRNPAKRPIVLISEERDLRRFGVILTPEIVRFLKRVWHGPSRRPVSIALPVAGVRFKYLHKGTGSIAFRLPRSRKLRDLIRATGPLAAPSANPEGKSPARTIKEARAYFGDQISFYVDGGRIVGKASRLVRLKDGEEEVLRP